MNNLGAVYQRLGEYEKARDLFLKSGTSLRYGFSMPNTNLGLVYVILGDAQKAKTAFEDSIRYNPMDETAYTSLARVNLALGEYNEAEKYARLDLKYHPSSVDSLKLLITVNEKNFKWDEALGAARTLLKKNLGDKDRLKERVALLEEEKMKWQKAADLKKSRPLPSEWYETMSDLYVSVGIPAQARATLENGLKEYPNNATLRRSLGAVLLKLGDSGRAESELARAVEMDKSSPENYFLLAKTYTLGLEFQKARTAAEQVLRLKNDYPGADRLLKVIERDGKKYQSLVKRGLTDAPEGDLVIGDIYESYGLLDESLKYYRRALKGPGQKIRAMYRIANNKLKRGTIPDMMESIKVLKEITRLKPDEAEAYKNLGFTYLFRVEDYEEAYRYFKTSLRVDPEQPGADKLSRIVEALGGYIDAVVVKRIYVLPFVAELQNYKSMIGSSNESSKSIMAR
jgi:tetratricopeptide (TPR) repeat protein